MKKGFSLIELLISLIVISIILTALAPILTKKLKTSNIALAAKDSLKTNCYHIDEDGFCKLCIKNECVSCSRNCEQGYYPDPLSCKCKSCAEGCKICTDGYSCTVCKPGYGSKEKICAPCPDGTFSSSGVCESCPNGFIDAQKTTCTACSSAYGQYCSTCNNEQCLSCITSDYELSDNKKFCKLKDPCVKYNAVLVENAQRGIRICVTKYNAGDAGGLGIPSGVTTRTTSPADGGTGAHNGAICWMNNTAANCNTQNGSYSGCKRTVCTWFSADKICKYHGWRLPYKDEIPYFANFSISKGTEGLQLCDRFSTSKSAYCSDSSECAGSSTGICFPSHIWSGEVFSSLRRNDFYLSGGNIGGPEANNASYAFSVRCVKNAQ